MSGTPSGLTPRTNNSSLGLGAVGGPRGFAAGVTQVLVNFLLNYNRGNLDQLAADLKAANAQQVAAAQQLAELTAKQQTQELLVNRAKQVRNSLDKDGLAALKNIQAVAAQALGEQSASGIVSKETVLAYQSQRAQLAQVLGIREEDVKLLLQQQDLVAQLAQIEQQRATAVEQNAAAQGEVVALQRQQSFLEQAAGRAGSRLLGLAIGVAGGTLGGQLVSSVLMGPAQEALKSLGDRFQALVDPEQAATEAAKSLGDAVNSIASSDKITQLEAARKLLQQIAELTSQPSLVNDTNAAYLESLGLNQEIAKTIQLEVDALKEAKGQASGVRDAFRDLYTASGNQNPFDPLLVAVATLSTGPGGLLTMLQQQDNVNQAIKDALPGLQANQRAIDANTAATERWKTAQQAYNDELAQARSDAAALSLSLTQSAIDTYTQSAIAGANSALSAITAHIDQVTTGNIANIAKNYDSLIQRIQSDSNARLNTLQNRLSNLQLTPSARTNSLQAQLDALSNSAASKRTQELADAIDHLNAAQAKAAYQSQLADIAEQKHQILLAQSLALTTQQINIDKYQGQDRITAIDALLAKMDERNQAQQNFNKLLEIQYQINKGVQRQQGETIQDFIARRAEYYRGLLQQAAEINQQGPKAALEAEKARVQTSIELKDLEAKKRKLIEDHARAAYLQSLQDELKASQQRDKDALDSRRKALQSELAASQKADQARLASEKQTLQDAIAAEKDNTARRIADVEAKRDKEIAAANATRNAAISAAQTATDAIIKGYQIRADQLKKWADYGNTQNLISALKGASTLAQLQSFSGAVSGAMYAMSYLQQTGQYLGLSSDEQQRMVVNLAQLIQAYSRKLESFYGGAAYPAPPAPPSRFGIGQGYAQGGAFMLNNSNTPLRGNIRWGDGSGDELGIVLSNKVVQALREQNGGSQPLIGSMTIQGSIDPMRDTARWRREVRSLIREELHN